jgi:TM2 domain-containing membrane protein YozV
MNRPPVAALLSFLIPGVGQIYNREYLRGLFWLVITPGLWIGSAGLLGWVLHFVSAATAYHRAELQQRRLSWPMRLEA